MIHQSKTLRDVLVFVHKEISQFVSGLQQFCVKPIRSLHGLGCFIVMELYDEVGENYCKLLSTHFVENKSASSKLSSSTKFDDPIPKIRRYLAT